jgi:hypothetical protein
MKKVVELGAKRVFWDDHYRLALQIREADIDQALLISDRRL